MGNAIDVTQLKLGTFEMFSLSLSTPPPQVVTVIVSKGEGGDLGGSKLVTC